jgi:hypothetical protein
MTNNFDYEFAIPYLYLAVKQGYGFGQYKRGIIHEDELRPAVRLFKKAADQSQVLG